MKYNLKNRPKAKYPHNSTTEKWFKEFERELREELKIYSWRTYHTDYGKGRESKIKEILGE